MPSIIGPVCRKLVNIHMSLVSLWFRISVFLLACLLSACGGGGSSATPPVGGLVAVAGGGRVTLTWQATPGVDYWLLYAPQSNAIDMLNPPGAGVTEVIGSPTPVPIVGQHAWLRSVTSPLVLSGLADGQTYAFALNGRVNGGPGGTQTPTAFAVPRPAGATWSPGSPAGLVGTNDLHGVAYGTASDATADYVAVGNGGSIYHSVDGLAWTQSTSAPSVNFNAITYASSYAQFYAVGVNDSTNPGNNVYRSADMVTWTPALVGVSGGLNAVISYSTSLVGVGNNGVASYSTDGVNWTTVPSVVSAALRSVAYSPSAGLWVAVGDGGTVLTSPDAVNWTDRTAAVNAAANHSGNALQSVVYSSSGALVAVGLNGTIIASTDGV